MKREWRMLLFFAGAAGIAVLFAIAIGPLAHPRDIRNQYAAAINSATFSERNVTDAVSAVNFDFRGFDTVGEEFILLVSVLGSLVLLRMTEDRKGKVLPDALSPWRDVGPSDAIRLWILAMIAPKITFGIYIVTHGQLTPGGGFQGGVILASAALILYLGEGFAVFRNIISHTATHVSEGAGALAFVMIGMLAWIWGRPFLTNVLPLGRAHELTSGGTMALISVATGLEVAAGFILLLYAFLQENLSPLEEET
jgi:multicomponent Na+:H+ antiporter subunit B